MCWEGAPFWNDWERYNELIRFLWMKLGKLFGFRQRLCWHEALSLSFAQHVYSINQFLVLCVFKQTQMCIRRRLQQGLTINSIRKEYPVTSGQDSKIDFVQAPVNLLYDIAIILILPLDLDCNFSWSLYILAIVYSKKFPVLVISNLVKWKRPISTLKTGYATVCWRLVICSLGGSMARVNQIV